MHGPRHIAGRPLKCNFESENQKETSWKRNGSNMEINEQTWKEMKQALKELERDETDNKLNGGDIQSNGWLY